MDQEKGPFKWLKNLFSNNEQTDKKSGKYQYLLLVLLFGAAIMLVSNMFFQEEGSNATLPTFNSASEEKGEVETFGQKKTEENDIIASYEHHFETELEEALEGITGVDDVMVVVNVDSTERKVLEKNTVTNSQKTDETDREGGKRIVEDQSKDEQLVIIRNGESEGPIILETKKPEIRGVLVVAKGADNIQVKKWIIESVTRLLDVPSHRVSVMPKK
ncbi:stage III sporulation protein AG [Cytobacillus sp. FJAT-54145]|uniref:Stage III sporulation protein AG n=1 Tax=Cytobacillus spartinae TaxID=3299023 RepID=A0ABW6KE37_9BACI